ncbi:MAG TPA: RDD family protein [Patescibacteria group bacterium]|nr:RDD family protein [Patescibacteria group bacterium]
MAYSDIPTRVFAYIIDAVILSVGFFVLFSVLGALFFSSLLIGGLGFMGFVWLLVLMVAYAAGSAIYFIYTWTNLRGSPGQRLLGLETLNAADGTVLTQPQAIRRWLFLFGPSVVATVLSLTPFLGGLGSLAGFVIWGYVIYLLYTAANSPTRQGFHDAQASTVVVKIRK